MKTRIIIENRTALSDIEAVERALRVMRKGKISGKGERAQYCYGCTFGDGIVVWAMKNRGGSDRLVVMKTPPIGEPDSTFPESSEKGLDGGAKA